MGNNEKEKDNDIYTNFAPPGHYYSTIPNRADLLKNRDRIFNCDKKVLPGIFIDDERMIKILRSFGQTFGEFPYTEVVDQDLIFHFNNGVFEWGEAAVLYSLIRFYKPKRIIEVGSGFSTAVMLDVSRKFFDDQIQITCVEPYPDRLMELIKGDLNRVTLIQEPLQDVEINLFKSLEADDLLFFDSTHVSKCDSDVNRIFFEVLPTINEGVVIHFHDVFYPFEYPERWLTEVGAAWNEDYLLRAFLQFNQDFRILFFNDYANRFFRQDVTDTFKNPNQWLGSSIWLERHHTTPNPKEFSG